MKQIAIRYGLLSALVSIGIALISWRIFGDDYRTQEVLGYSSMILASAFIIFGLKHYRDQVNGGVMTYGQALKVGALIMLIPSVLFGVFDVVYTTVIDPEFMEKYYTYTLEQAKLNLTPEKYAERVKTLQKEKELFGAPIVQFFVMGLTIFLVGFVMTLIAGLFLRKKAEEV